MKFLTTTTHLDRYVSLYPRSLEDSSKAKIIQISIQLYQPETNVVICVLTGKMLKSLGPFVLNLPECGDGSGELLKQ